MCLVSLALSAALIPIVIWLCNKYHWYDTIDARKVHTGNIPRLGSVGFVAAFSISSIIYSIVEKDAHLFTLLPFVSAGFIIFLFGVIDDFLNLKAKYKLTIQVIAAAIIVLSGYRFKNIGSLVLSLWLSYALTFCWIIGIINAFNLIDGIDGLCGGLSSLIILTLAVIYSASALHSSAICFILVFAICGFLIYNNPHPKAKISMYLKPEELIGKNIILAANLAPRKMRGVESHGMLLAADYKNAEGKDCVEVLTAPWAQPGTKVVLEGADPAASKPAEISADDFFKVAINVVNKSVEICGKKLVVDGKALSTEITLNSEVK